MRSAFLILVCASGCLATGVRAEDSQNDPTGLWKEFTMAPLMITSKGAPPVFYGEVLPWHTLYALDYKDGKLTGRMITPGADVPLISPTFEGGIVSFGHFEGRFMGGAIIGKMGVRSTCVLARITPAGIWDLKMNDLTLAGQPWDSGDPLRSISDFMRFEYKDLKVTGAWKRGPGQPIPIKAVSFTLDGIAFSVAVATPSGNVVYEFTGEFVSTFPSGGMPKLHIRPAVGVPEMPKVIVDEHGAHVDDTGASLDQINGTVKITAPNGQTYKSKWHLVCNNGDRARVEIGTPYVVPDQPTTSSIPLATPNATLSPNLKTISPDLALETEPLPPPPPPRLPTETDVIPSSPLPSPPGPTLSSATGKIVALPPYFVEAERAWRYTSMPGFEVLSLCSESETRKFAAAMYAQHLLLHEIVPPELEYQTAVPTELILFSRERESAMNKEMLALMADVRMTAGGQTPPSRDIPQGIPQMVLSDGESTGVDFVLKDDRSDDYKDGHLFPDYITYLLVRRSPPLPAWFVQGVVDLYERTAFSGDSLLIGPVIWISADVTKGIAYIPKFSRELLPMVEVLTNRAPPDSGSDEEQRRFSLWRSQADLFVRWALDGQDQPRRRALWDFADRASKMPVTEEMFRECFGAGFAEVRTQLNDYLPTAVTGSIVLPMRGAASVPRLQVRPATTTEIGRILGDWDSKEITFVRESFPDYAPKYIEQAGRVLANAYSQDGGDPALQAVYGLYQYDAGDNVKARQLLEAAVRSRVVRPLAYVVLARLRLAEALAKPAGSGGRLSTQQVEAVLDPLRIARTQSPPQPETYALIATVWSHSADAPTGEILAELDEGIHFFPTYQWLIDETSALKLRVHEASPGAPDSP